MHLVKTILTAGLLLSAAAQAHNVLEFPQPENNPEEFYAVTEIPTGGIIKYETDAKTGFIVADRFQSMPVAYPANYGSLTQSLAGDGDPLDVVFYTRAPMAPGTLIKLRAIGVLKMIDGGEKDDKIIAVPASKIDPTYDDIKTISDLPKIEQQRLEAFFRVYKELPEGRKKVELAGFNDAAAAEAGDQIGLGGLEGEEPAIIFIAGAVRRPRHSLSRSLWRQNHTSHVTRQRLSHHIAS